MLEALGKPSGVVIGTFGVERHSLRFTGQAAHSGSTPIEMRRDAFLAAAEAALGFRDIARRHSSPGAGVVCTVGVVNVEPRVVTAVPGVCGDLPSISGRSRPPPWPRCTAKHRRSPRAAPARTASAWSGSSSSASPRVPSIRRRSRFCEEALREETGEATLLPSGPLHDAAEMAPIIPR